MEVNERGVGVDKSLKKEQKTCALTGTALEVMHIFIDWEAKWEQMQEDLGDDVVDTGHGVDDGENFDFDSNLGE